MTRRRDPHMQAVYRRRRATALAVPAGIALVLVLILGHGGSSAPSASVAASHATVPTGGAARTRRATASTRQATAPARPLTALERRVARLTPAQLAGQRIIYAYSGSVPPPSLLAAIRAGEAAGVILFGDNAPSSAAVAAAAQMLQSAAARSPVKAPLLVVADQEGGEVRRLPGGPALSEQTIGRSAGALGLARDAGIQAAAAMREAHANVNLSPVLDVARSPSGFIAEYARSYGADAGLDGRLGAAFIAAEQRAGLPATVKHFPGLGAAARGHDTDSRPVTLSQSLSELRAVDEAPYRAALAAGADLVMPSWAIYPALDGSAPAGLSSRVIGGELRGRLGFRGVTISDTLSAGALTRYGPLSARGLLAARAGADLLICSAVSGLETPDDGLSVLSTLTAALRTGRLGLAASRAAAVRVLALRSKLLR